MSRPLNGCSSTVMNGLSRLMTQLSESNNSTRVIMARARPI
jgi:hypothetical protein